MTPASFITADQLLAHAIGDYVLQSHWMATEKTKRSWPAITHALVYALVFWLAFRPSTAAWAVIYLSHYLIDRWRLARFVVLAKNVLLSPLGLGITPGNGVMPDYVTATGYPDDVPPWLSVWLLIVADNVMHVAINGAALRWL